MIVETMTLDLLLPIELFQNPMLKRRVKSLDECTIELIFITMQFG